MLYDILAESKTTRLMKTITVIDLQEPGVLSLGHNTQRNQIPQ